MHILVPDLTDRDLETDSVYRLPSPPHLPEEKLRHAGSQSLLQRKGEGDDCS